MRPDELEASLCKGCEKNEYTNDFTIVNLIHTVLSNQQKLIIYLLRKPNCIQTHKLFPTFFNNSKQFNRKYVDNHPRMNLSTHWF